MSTYRRNSAGFASGDTIPFYHDGVYHLFYLSCPPGTLRYPERCRNTWRHVMTKDLIHWEECPSALEPGVDTDLDVDGCWTGSVIYANGEYHIFYTAYQIESQFPQKICHATSDDCIHWKKDVNNPTVVPDTSMYENIDWRDPYIFYNEEDECYWMLIAARRNVGPNNRRGVVILYKSKDLVNFTHYGPLYEPWHTNCPECPEMYKLGDYWYLVYSRYSERGQTLYRYSKSPYGPWRTPKMDGIDGRRFYAAKSMANDEGRRFYFAWIPERENFSDDNPWQTGGDFGIPHEVKSMPNGDLHVFMPKESYEGYSRTLSYSFEPKLGNAKLYGDTAIAVDSIGTLTNGFFRPSERDFMFECDIRASDCGDYFGFSLKTDDDMDEGFLLAFDISAQRVYLNKIPGELDPFWADLTNSKIVKCEVDGPRPCEKPYNFKNGDYIHVKIVMTGSLIEMYIDDCVVFSYRSYRETNNMIGIFAQDCNVEYLNIKFKAEEK